MSSLEAETDSSGVQQGGRNGGAAVAGTLDSVPPAAKDPRGFARVGIFGVVWSLALIALAVVAAHDVLTYVGAITDQAWIEQVLIAGDGLRPRYWWVMLSVLAIAVGLGLVLMALQPRPRLGTPVTAATGVFLLHRSMRHLAVAAAEDVDGVVAATARTTAHTLRVDVRGLSAGRDRDLEDRVTVALQKRLQPLADIPRIRVRDRGRG